MVPAQDIDGPAIPEVVERHFDRRLPAQLREQPNYEVDEIGVGCIEQAVQTFAVPSNADVEVGAEGLTSVLDAAKRDPAQGATLDPAVLRSRDPGRSRDINLAPSASNPKHAERAADPESVHIVMMNSAAYQPVA